MDNRQAEIIKNLNNWFTQFWEDRNINLIDEDGNYKKIPTNRFSACMMYIYDNYVNKLEYKTKRGFKQYIYSDYIIIVQWYISKIREYDIISFDGFVCLLNRSKDWFYQVKNNLDNIKSSFIFSVVDINTKDNNNSVCVNNNNSDYIYNSLEDSLKTLEGDVEKATLHTVDITKMLYQALQDMTANKLNDTPLGLVTNANNNNEIGLNYAKERIQETAKARQKIALADLPLLE